MTTRSFVSQIVYLPDRCVYYADGICIMCSVVVYAQGNRVIRICNDVEESYEWFPCDPQLIVNGFIVVSGKQIVFEFLSMLFIADQQLLLCRIASSDHLLWSQSVSSWS